jgi:hypothetical protein
VEPYRHYSPGCSGKIQSFRELLDETRAGEWGTGMGERSKKAVRQKIVRPVDGWSHLIGRKSNRISEKLCIIEQTIKLGQLQGEANNGYHDNSEH